MTPFYADDWLTVYLGDCRAVMAAMEPESVHCVVTSPPYWGLRDYGTATWTGGNEDCGHVQRMARGDAGRLSTDDRVGINPAPVETPMHYRDVCGRCGATRVDQQLGLEPTPDLYVAAMVEVFREVRRVLRKDGTLWLNLGDSYAGGTQTGRNDAGRPEKGRGWAEYDIPRTRVERRDGLKPKDLVGIPWRVAFALQADGWYLRSDIIWSKPNPMPESVTDRPTKAHEYLFLLSKSPTYYFDADAVREPHIEAHLSRYRHDFWPEGTKEANGSGRPGAAANTGGTKEPNPLGRNIRSVWEITTQPYPGAHFATFPQALVEPCVKAGCPEGGTVLDPFAGSGTVGVVAQRLSRRAVLIDLSAAYLGQLMRRNADIPLGLAGDSTVVA